MSNLGSRISKLVCRCDLSDPMSGFFVADTAFFRASVPHLTGTGFKILVDILASSPVRPRIAEVPYQFRNRLVGESKLDVNVELEYLFLIADNFGQISPYTVYTFSPCGSLGLLIHLSILGLFHLVNTNAFSLARCRYAKCNDVQFLLEYLITFGIAG